MRTQRGLTGSSEVARAVDRQMREWELARSQRLTVPAEKRREIEDFVCISRMVGLDTGEVVERLGERLGWPVFDRQILERMAGDDDVRRRLYLGMDGRDLAWWETAMSPFVLGKAVTDDYFHRLCDHVLALARQGSCIFVGRGAELILPRDRGLRVRLVAAPETVRRAVARARDLTEREAGSWLEQEQESRARFFRRHFRNEPTDAGRYDLTVNLERLGTEDVVEIVLTALALRQRKRAAVAV